jgi:hypothetical protein
MLFDQLERKDKRFRAYSEPYYDYLNRSSRKSSEQIRLVLENWFSRIPPANKKELQIRFRSSVNVQHQGAFFELYLHELLLRLGYKVEIHPKIKAKPTHPEFLVFSKDNPIFYLEGTVAIGSNEEVATEKRENIIYDTLDKLNSPNFFLEVRVNTYSEMPPSGANWRTVLEKKLAQLDPDELSTKVGKNGFELLPSWTLEDRGWKVTFRPIPKSLEARGKPGIRPIGIRWFGPIWCKDHINIRNAIKEKASKYGNLGLPYIIAINVTSYYCDELSIADALFGEENVTVFRKSDGSFNHMAGRNPNGAWWGPRGPQNRRVSAVLMFCYLLWGNIGKLTPLLWHNPWTSKPLDFNFWPIPQMLPNPETSKMEKRSGKTIGEIFNLSPNWPFVEEEEEE